MARGPQSTFDVERLRLLAAGMSAADVAKEMGISRQRVYQVAGREGISFNPPPRPARILGRRSKPDKQVSRVITGGVVESVGSSRASGRICELLVAADLVARGWKVFFPMNMGGPHDLIAAKADVVCSFEVRAAKLKADGSLAFRRDTTPRSEFYAVVARGQPVVYEPVLPHI